MKVVGLQMDVQFSNPDANYEKAESLIREAMREKVDVLVLPEMWNTGFFPKEGREQLADEEAQRTFSFLSRLAKEFDVNIVGGSILERRADKYYNTALVVNRKGELVARYSKVHLFTFMKEEDYFEAGNELCTFELDGVPCGLIICYDLRFLELIRSLCLKGIDILFVPAEWPDKRVVHWETLSRARAIENQVFVAAVNGCGTMGDTQYGGHSALIDPWGEYLAKAGEKEEVFSAELDLKKVQDIRETINVYRDRRPDVYQLD